MAKDIKEHIDECLLPIREEIDEHELILHGRNKMNGLIGEARDINTRGRLIKRLAGIGELSGIGACTRKTGCATSLGGGRPP